MPKPVSFALSLGAAFTFFSGAAASRIYFNNPTTFADYRLTSIEPVVENAVFSALNEGACGVDTAVNTTALDFDKIFSWHNGNTQFARGVGDRASATVEDCVRELIKNAVSDSGMISNDMAIYILLLSLLGYAVCVCTTLAAARRYCYSESQDRPHNSNDIEIGVDAPNLQALIPPSLEDASNSTLAGIECEEKRGPSFSERLDALQFDRELPHEFCCPISQDIMNCPVLFSDGHNYDKQSILLLMQRPGPLRSPITNMPAARYFQVNYDLNSQIDDFVRATEQQHKDADELALAPN